MNTSREPLNNVGSEELARQIRLKKRSLYVINEHFDARSSKVVFQRFPRMIFNDIKRSAYRAADFRSNYHHPTTRNQ